MSGAVAQARRRSATTTNEERTTPEEGNDEGWSQSINVEEDEILDCLKTHTCYGSGEAKKNLLRRIVEKRPALLLRFKTHCAHLEQSFDMNMPTMPAHVNKLSVRDVVKKLSQAKVILDEYLLSEPIKTTLVDSMDYLRNEIKNMRKEAHDTVKQKKQDSMHNQLIKLNLAEKNRKFMEDGFIPTDESHRTCPFCRHSNLDEPDSNGSLLDSNLLGLAKHNR
jgi:hypothetical protein